MHMLAPKAVISVSEWPRGVVLVLDLADAASVVLKALLSGGLGDLPAAIITLEERLKPEGLKLTGEGVCTSEDLLIDGRCALTSAAVAPEARLALLGICRSGLAPQAESEAIAQAVQALQHRYQTVVVLNRHVSLVPLLRVPLEVADGVLMAVDARSSLHDVQTASSLLKGFGEIPMLWYICREGSECDQAAERWSGASGLPLWTTTSVVDAAPKPAAKSEGGPHMETIEPGRGDARVAEVTGMVQQAPPVAGGGRTEPAVVRGARTSAPAPVAATTPVSAPAQSSSRAPRADGELLDLVQEYVVQLQELRQTRQQMTSTRQEMQRQLAKLSELIGGGAVPAEADLRDLSRRRGALEDLDVRHQKEFSRCSSDWAFLQQALDPSHDGPEN